MPSRAHDGGHTVTETETVYSQPTTASDPPQQPPNPQAAPPPPRGQAYYAPPPPPPLYAFPPPPFGPPPLGIPVVPSAGAVMGPGTAIVSILVIAGIYWALKNGSSLTGGGSAQPQLQPPGPPSSEAPKDGKKDSKSTDAEMVESGPTVSIPVVSPSAFVCLFTFSLLTVVMIQGPLGISAAFASPMPLKLASLNGGTTMSPSLLDFIGKTLGSAASTSSHPQVVKVQARTSSSTPSPQMGGQGQTSGPDGTTNQWHWFANPLPPLNQQQAPAAEETIVIAPTGMSKADAMAFATLPPLLQDIAYCRSSPSVCASLLSNVDLAELSRLVGPSLGLTMSDLASALGQTPTARPNPVPLIPPGGFAGSVQGIASWENAFYPMLVGAIGLVVLFDYGT